MLQSFDRVQNGNETLLCTAHSLNVLLASGKWMFRMSRIDPVTNKVRRRSVTITAKNSLPLKPRRERFCRRDQVGLELRRRSISC